MINKKVKLAIAVFSIAILSLGIFTYRTIQHTGTATDTKDDFPFIKSDDKKTYTEQEAVLPRLHEARKLPAPAEVTQDVFSKDTEIKKLIKRLSSEDISVSRKAAAELVKSGHDSTQALLEALPKASVFLKGQIIFILGRIKDKNATPQLAQLLKNDNAYIRRNAAEALGKIKDESVIYDLSNSLLDDDISVRERSAWALGEIKDRSAAQPLMSRIKEEDEERVKLALVNALGKIKDKRATFVLIEELKSKNDQLYKNELVFVLGEIGDSKTLSELGGYVENLKESEPTEPIAIFEWKQAIKIAEEAMQKIKEQEDM